MFRIYLFASLLLTTLWVHGQGKEYIVEGKIENAPDSAIIMLTRMIGNSGTLVEQDTIFGGKFYFRGYEEDTPVRMALYVLNDPNFYGLCNLWIGEGVTRVTGDSYCLSVWKVKSGVKEQKEENKFLSKTRSHIEAAEKFSRESGNRINLSDIEDMGDALQKNPVFRQMDSLYALVNNATLDVLAKRPVSAVSLEKLSRMCEMATTMKASSLDKEKVEKQYLRLDSSQQNSYFGGAIQSFLYPPVVVGVGDTMVDGVLRDLQGKQHRLSDYKGKYILLDFWSCGCGPCIMAQPELENVAKLHGDSLCVISINLDASEQMWRRASEKISGGINLSDMKGRSGGISAHYGVTGMPLFVIVDRSGVIVDKWFGYGKNIIRMKLKKYWEKQQNAGKN